MWLFYFLHHNFQFTLKNLPNITINLSFFELLIKFSSFPCFLPSHQDETVVHFNRDCAISSGSSLLLLSVSWKLTKCQLSSPASSFVLFITSFFSFSSSTGRLTCPRVPGLVGARLQERAQCPELLFQLPYKNEWVQVRLLAYPHASNLKDWYFHSV